MSFTLHITDAVKSIKIDSDTPLTTTDQGLFDILTKISVLSVSVPIKDILVKRDNGNPKLYTYSVTASDARQWNQTVLFPAIAGGQITMTFDIGSSWSMNEIGQQRAINDLIVTMLQQFSVSKFVYDLS